MSRILQALALHAARRPRDLAVQGDEQHLSWRELEQESGKLAGVLGNVSCLGLFLNNSPAWVTADIAALRRGIRCVPVPGFFSLEQQRHVLEDAAVDALLFDHVDMAGFLDADWEVRKIPVAGQSLVLARRRQGDRSRIPVAEKITYTSGTTGRPRGVRLGMETVETVALSLCRLSGATADDRALALLPLSILLENIGSLYVPLLAGATMLVPSPGKLGLDGSGSVDAARLAAGLALFRPTAAIVPPQLLKLLTGLAGAGRLPDSFRFIAVGGAMLPASQMEAARSLGLPVYQGYGLSEACSVVAMNSPDACRDSSVGRVLPHCELRIADDGEILVRGALFRGYLHGENWNLDKFLPTGDLGYLDEEGFLHVMGRKKNLLVTAYGRNVSPEWPEAELLAEPEISQAAVFGDGRPWLSAVLLPAAHADMEKVRRAVERANARLPDYARIMGHVPADEAFTPLNGQATANGRLRRDRIYRIYRHRIDALYPREDSLVS
ncbi:AMP-binding protein [Thiolapillus sp.]